MVRKVRGNLLNADVDALVNTVNTVGVMGRGIALQFKKAFPAEYFRAYEAACKSGEVRVGRVHVYDNGGLNGPRYIINFPTKKHWRGASRMEWVREGLVSLVETIHRLDITSVALPPLGCGLGGLSWDAVYPEIVEAFRELPDVDVMAYEPAGVPEAEMMKDVTARPRMTVGRAVVLVLMDRYLVPGFDYRLSLLEVQKLVYFQVAAGEHLNQVEFAKGVYGPYADTLRHVLEKMDHHFIAGYGDGQNKPEMPIRLLPDAAAEAREFLNSPEHRATHARFDRVIELIEGFETPYGMELLSSVHWVATREAARTPGAAVEAIQRWTERKASLIRPEHIHVAWTRLAKQGWIGA
jgi:O-acetyl-ADP-ribose deacetylase (regulator of RNase III)